MAAVLAALALLFASQDGFTCHMLTELAAIYVTKQDVGSM